MLVSDEIYELFDYENKFCSPASIYPRTVTMMGFSKAYSMTGLRLAAATGPKEIIQAMVALQQYTVVCAPAPAQWAGIVALETDVSSHVLEYKLNRDYCLERLKGKLSVVHPSGAFYIFIELPQSCKNDKLFVERAIKEKSLLLIPGRIFSFDKNKNFIRLSYSTDKATLERGLDALLSLLNETA